MGLTDPGMLKLLFLFSFFLLVYTWCVFPVIIFLVALFRKKEAENNFPPKNSTVSVVIAAFNEENTIGERIENLLKSDYPLDKLEIIVASDGSSDRTVEISQQYSHVKVLDYTVNRGRASVHNDAVAEANGEIIVFTDAETVFEEDFLKEAVQFFGDDGYGCGAGNFSFKPRGAVGVSEGFYWKMEKMIRQSEFSCGILPFASGGCFLIRRDLFEPIAPSSDIDNILPLLVIEKGKKVFYAKDAKAYDVTVDSEEAHYKKRVRTAQRSFADIVSCFPQLWRTKKYVVLWVLISHRIIRWLTGYLGGILFFANFGIILSSSINFSFWTIFFIVQIASYLLCLLGWFSSKGWGMPKPLKRLAGIAYSFFLANLAFTVAVANVVLGRKIFSYKQ